MPVRILKYAALFSAVVALSVGLGASAAHGGATGDWVAAAATAAKRISLKSMTVEAGHSRLVDLPADIKRVSVGNEKVADVVVIGPRQIYVNGRAVGSTNISVWDKAERLMGVFRVQVIRDLTRLKMQLHQVMPDEPIEVRELEGVVVLSGRVSSLAAKKKAEAIAAAFAPKKFASVLEVGGVKQVMIEVRFAEVSRKVTKRLNFNIGLLTKDGNFLFTFINQLVKPDKTAIGLDSFSTELQFAKNMNTMFGYTLGGTRYMGFLDALKENGLAKILAEPNLIATSGQKANFLAGGEYPVPVPKRDTIGIEFKKFGVQLTFKPEVLDNGKIKLEVEPEVSELDYTTALLLEGFQVPGLTTRRAKTQLELSDGQSFAIAGLLRDDLTQVVSKIPFLGDIPVLGTLFRSTDYQTKKTDLLIVVTPRIVRPGVHAPDRFPGEMIQEPSEWRLFLLGEMAKLGPRSAPRPSAAPAGLPKSLNEMEGRFGHEWID